MQQNILKFHFLTLLAIREMSIYQMTTRGQ